MPAEIAGLKKTITADRSEVAELKSRLLALERAIAAARKAIGKATPPKPADADPPAGSARFSAKGLAGHRARLQLSAQDCGLLIGVTRQTIYALEAGKTRPRASQMPAVQACR